jgi:hypothetical protein
MVGLYLLGESLEACTRNGSKQLLAQRAVAAGGGERDGDLGLSVDTYSCFLNFVLIMY